MTIYLSGPMTGYPSYNADLFGAVASMLKERGFDVVNPHNLPEPPGIVHSPDQDWWLYIRRCLDYLHEHPVDLVLLLPGHEESFGASMERMFAEKHDIPVRQFNDFMLDEFLKGGKQCEVQKCWFRRVGGKPCEEAAPKEADHAEAK